MVQIVKDYHSEDNGQIPYNAYKSYQMLKETKMIKNNNVDKNMYL